MPETQKTVEPVDVEVPVPGAIIIHDVRVDGHIHITFEGHPVGRTWRERFKTAWYVLTGRANKLYAAQTQIIGCNVGGIQIAAGQPPAEAS